MSKKLNDVFGTSRMMLFEHRDELVEHSQKKKLNQHKPELDEQLWEEVNERIGYSYQEHEPISLLLYNPVENEVVTGVVTAVDPLQKRVQLNERWVNAKDIIGVSSSL